MLFFHKKQPRYLQIITVIWFVLVIFMAVLALLNIGFGITGTIQKTVIILILIDIILSVADLIYRRRLER